MSKIDETIDGKTYRIIFEEPNLNHPEGSAVGVFTGEYFSEVVCKHVANPNDSAEDIRKQANLKASQHALTR